MKVYVSLLVLLLTAFANAQMSSKDVLFTVDGEPIKAEEFIRVYNKNLDLVKDESQKDIDGYLNLFINYQLKIKEAKRLGLDNDPSYIKEFSGYKDQLVKNYLSDSKVTEALMKEAYDRMGYDLKASHILIRMEESETDTLKVYQDLMDLRDRVITEGFDQVKAEVHDGQNVFAENLGYFSAFKMVYEFENAAYNTKVGDVSKPFRTRFGYHIVNVEDKRSSLGEVTVAHIMVTAKENDSLIDPEKRINELYKKISQGENFESLAKQFSDDKSSANNGGELGAFSSGQLSAPEFEAVAFGLKTVDDISKPFKTNYGWHIVKLLDKKGIPPYEDVKYDIENKIKRDSRSKLINTTLANDLRTTYQVTINPKAKAYFESILNPDFFSSAWLLPKDFKNEQTLVTVQNETITYGDFGNHLMSIQKVYAGKTMPFKTIIEKEYNGFEEDALLAYHEEHLEFENEEFGQILKEYRDGLLLFDLMEKEVWNAAALDSVGLQNHYNTHKDDYVWEDRVDVIIATSAKEDAIKTVEKLLKKGKSSEAISEALNTDQEQKVIFTKGIKPLDYQGFPKDAVVKKGLSKVYQYNDAYHIIKVEAMLPKTNKTFEEAKGKVISDYQNTLEKNWLNELNQRYEVKVIDAVLQDVKFQIKQEN
ncbi:peptidyl-prolyl cis-trans isomerase SurA [Gelidibacter algens]|uniref:Peptidyl-prolyl cis-trans isomerase SurA n=1 Tax=Gelidibacter algens TaxID=49280 RepID=A0A1A7R1I7_9FLAO|nr:peptidylprolyl isomerase [Gelidibacter algens]OBX25344.1 peptidylprolyl isomerase [Gelidibacter algens]RAJ25190.1 peptidyl-prolyl cis-trans isomerase SurA [Gelidibacter algens]